MIKVHIFDVDGTLLDSMRMWDSLSSLYLKSIGIDPPEDLAETLDPMTYPEAKAYLADHFHIEGGLPAVEAGLDTFLQDQYDNRLRLFDGVMEELEEISQLGQPMYVFSNTPHRYLDAALDRVDISRFFHAVYTVDDVGIRKDYADAFRKLCGMLGVEPCEALIYEDSTYAIKAAREAGCPVKIYDRYR